MSSSIELRERRISNRSRNQNPTIGHPPAPNYSTHAMPGIRPIVSAVQAWSWCVVFALPGPDFVPMGRKPANASHRSVVISVFAILILGTLGLLFRANHHSLVGGTEDPENGPEVAGTIFIAVLVYAVGRPRCCALSPDTRLTAFAHRRASWCFVAFKDSCMFGKAGEAPSRCKIMGQWRV